MNHRWTQAIDKITNSPRAEAKNSPTGASQSPLDEHEGVPSGWDSRFPGPDRFQHAAADGLQGSDGDAKRRISGLRGGIVVYYQLILAHIKGVIFSQAIKASPDNPAIPRNPRATQNKQPKPTCKWPLIGRGTNAVALGRTVPSVSNQRRALNSWSQILFSNWLIVFLSTGI